MEHHHKKQNNKDTKERENKENEISRASGRKIQNKIFSYELDFIGKKQVLYGFLNYNTDPQNRMSKILDQSFCCTCTCINFMDFGKVLKWNAIFIGIYDWFSL